MKRKKMKRKKNRDLDRTLVDYQECPSVPEP